MYDVGALTGWAYAIITLLKVLVVFFGVMVVVAMLTLMERKVSAWMQDRLGPNRVGPGGLLQPAADGLKNILKEETYPVRASMVFFVLAPMLSIGPALMTFGVIPLAAPLPTPWGLVDMIIADLPIGILYILALTGLGIYGIVMAGWSSNSKYSFIGGMRAAAQMVSYEVSLGLSLIPVFFLAGNVTLTQIVWTQQEGLGLWLAFPLGLLRFQPAQFHVRVRGCLLEHREGVDQFDRHTLAADLEVLPRALGLGSPIAVGGNLYLAERVLLDPDSHLLPLFSCCCCSTSCFTG